MMVYPRIGTLLEAGGSHVTVAVAQLSLLETVTFCGSLTVKIMGTEWIVVYSDNFYNNVLLYYALSVQSGLI